MSLSQCLCQYYYMITQLPNSPNSELRGSFYTGMATFTFVKEDNNLILFLLPCGTLYCHIGNYSPYDHPMTMAVPAIQLPVTTTAT